MAKSYEVFNNKRILITGGTGSFGNELIRQLESTNAEIVVLSRDEKKQHEMFTAGIRDEVQFEVGDIRDNEKLRMAMRDVDVVFHAAALKHVPVGEQFPEEMVATNIVGTQNVLRAAERAGVEKVINISTDKACEPINAYGMSKSLAEKIASAHRGNTAVVSLRYGNVLGSRGSVVPLFEEQIAAGRKLTITNPDMTRFLMPLSHAASLVEKCMRDGAAGDLFVIRSPAATIASLVRAIELHYETDLAKQIIGIRPGEKMDEMLLTAEEARRATNTAEGDITFARIARRDPKINDFVQGDTADQPEPFTSGNAHRMDAEETLDLLRAAKVLGAKS